MRLYIFATHKDTHTKCYDTYIFKHIRMWQMNTKLLLLHVEFFFVLFFSAVFCNHLSLVKCFFFVYSFVTALFWKVCVRESWCEGTEKVDAVLFIIVNECMLTFRNKRKKKFTLYNNEKEVIFLFCATARSISWAMQSMSFSTSPILINSFDSNSKTCLFSIFRVQQMRAMNASASVVQLADSEKKKKKKTLCKIGNLL